MLSPAVIGAARPVRVVWQSREELPRCRRMSVGSVGSGQADRDVLVEGEGESEGKKARMSQVGQHESFELLNSRR
jgi:hypothetical protein